MPRPFRLGVTGFYPSHYSLWYRAEEHPSRRHRPGRVCSPPIPSWSFLSDIGLHRLQELTHLCSQKLTHQNYAHRNWPISNLLIWFFQHNPLCGTPVISFLGGSIMSRICTFCGRSSEPCPTVPDQRYCSRPECQKARRRKWQKEKLATDEAYRANQADCQRAWRQKNPDYWRHYREIHPAYTERNRQLQRQRNSRIWLLS